MYPRMLIGGTCSFCIFGKTWPIIYMFSDLFIFVGEQLVGGAESILINSSKLFKLFD